MGVTESITVPLRNGRRVVIRFCTKDLLTRFMARKDIVGHLTWAAYPEEKDILDVEFISLNDIDPTFLEPPVKLVPALTA